MDMNYVETLVSNIGKLRDLNPDRTVLNDIKKSINDIMATYTKSKPVCNKFIFTRNYDKMPFGCIVFPNLENVAEFIVGTGDLQFTSMAVELDSKVFDYGLTDEEITMLILYNCYHIMNDKRNDDIHYEIDMFFANGTNSCDVCMNISNIYAYAPILKMGLLDTLNMMTSCLNLPDGILNDPFLESLGLYGLQEMLNKLYRNIPGCNNEIMRRPNLSMLSWCLRLYNNINLERIPALRLMEKAKEINASELYRVEFDQVITAINNIKSDKYVIESAVNKILRESKKNGGLFSSLRYNGLRDIENDLYEFQIRARNSDGENEVMYALKQINARLAILDDYIKGHPEDPELERWIGVKMQYLDIRDAIAKKRLHKRAYGVFVDYNALDKLDQQNDGFGDF